MAKLNGLGFLIPSVLRRAFCGRIVAFVFLASALTSQAQADLCPNTEFGFSVSVPDDWDVVNASALEQLQRQIQAHPTANPIKCVVAYQPRAHGSGLQYPYLVVEVVSYPNGETHPKLSEKDLKELVAKLSGGNSANLTPAKDGKLSSAITASYQFNPPGFQFGAVIKGPEGDVRGQAVGRFGPNYVVQFCLYDTADDWDTFQPVARSIAASYYLNDAHSATFREESVNNNDNDGVWRNTLLTALVGGILASSLVRGKLRKGSPSEKPQGTPPEK